MLAAGFAALPLFTARNDFLNLGVQIFLAVALAQSWNLLGGYAGQINLGHAAFFGFGALVTRMLWVSGMPLILSIVAGAVVAMAFGLIDGVPAFCLRGAYFAIGTLAWPRFFASRSAISCRRSPRSARPSSFLQYSAALLSDSRIGRSERRRGRLAGSLAPWPRHSRRARRRSRRGSYGVSALRHKLLAFALSTAMAGLAGGAFAYYHVSYYPQHTFSPVWTFDAVLMSFIGGVGTVHGPVLGALFYVILKEVLAIRWVEFHLIIFGVLFILVVLFLPGGLVEAWNRARRLFSRYANG